MKKISLILICSTSLFAASNSEISDFYSKSIKAQLPNVTVSVGNHRKVGSTGFENIIVTITLREQKQEQILLTRDNLIVPDTIGSKTRTSYAQEYEMRKLQGAKANFIKNVKPVVQKETMLIALGDKNKPAVYVFSDPECPYCRDHLVQVKDELKNYQVDYILTPVHGKSTFEKSALIYKESKKAKSDDEKIAILNKYYDTNIKSYPKVGDSELKGVFSLYGKYRSLGLSATPTIIK